MIVQCTDPNVSTGSVSIRFFKCTDCTVQYRYTVGTRTNILLSHFDFVKYVLPSFLPIVVRNIGIIKRYIVASRKLNKIGACFYLDPFALCALARPLYRPDFVAVHIFCILRPFITVSWSCLALPGGTESLRVA
jgi:hypothetical protein